MGTVTLTNTKQYPFNDSEKLVALDSCRKNNTYFVLTEISEASGEVGDIIVSGKAINGFKIEYTGSATSAVINYCLIGEM